MMRAQLATATLAVLLGVSACAQEPKTEGAPPLMRRLTEAQYRNSIADVFGADIKIGHRLEPLVRTSGLMALGAQGASLTPSGMERMLQSAQAIAAQVVDAQHRPALVGCGPADGRSFDPECASRFFLRVGKALYRRPLTNEELAARLDAAKAASTALEDFYAGLASSLVGLLVSPNFLFLIDTTEPDPERPGSLRLDGYAKATRVSYFLWNAPPDDELLEVAGNGGLHTGAGLERQVDRMILSVRLENGLRGFFADAFAFDQFDTLEKDAIIYPAFNLAVANDAAEQVLRTLNEVLIVRGEDYRNLFTTRRWPMSNVLSVVYRVRAPNPEGWALFEFADDDPRVGIQSQLGFTSLHSHPGKSSPTLRGRAVRELLLCQRIPDPPPAVDFTQFNDPASPLKTARLRLAAHTQQPTCAGCHKLTDPIGLAMEEFDGAGQLRATEQGATIDPNGQLDGARFEGPAGFARALARNSAATTCVVNRLFAYGVGRAPTRHDRGILDFLHDGFAADDYRYPALLRRIATADAFYAVTPPKPSVAINTAGAP